MRDRIIRLAAIIYFKKYAGSPINLEDLINMTDADAVPFVLSHVKMFPPSFLIRAKKAANLIEMWLDKYRVASKDNRIIIAQELINLIRLNEEVFKNGVVYPRDPERMVDLLDARFPFVEKQVGIS